MIVIESLNVIIMFKSNVSNLQSLEEARVAMEVMKPVMLVTDEISNYWYSKLQIDHVPFLKWHILMNSPSHYSSKRFGNIKNYLFRETLNWIYTNKFWVFFLFLFLFQFFTWLFPVCVSVLTTEMLKKPAFTSLSLDYFHPPDGTAIICFTSGINY